MLKSRDLLGSDNDLILRKLPLKAFAQGSPEGGLRALDHYLDDSDAVFLRSAAALQQAQSESEQRLVAPSY